LETRYKCNILNVYSFVGFDECQTKQKAIYGDVQGQAQSWCTTRAQDKV